MVKKIVNNDMQEALDADVAVIDFSATWCGPCKMLAPVLDSIADELDGKAKFFNIDSDENMDLAVKYNISSIPALLILKKGEIADQQVGFKPKEPLKAWISSYLD